MGGEIIMWSINRTKNRTRTRGWIQSLDYHKEQSQGNIYGNNIYPFSPGANVLFQCPVISLRRALSTVWVIYISFVSTVGCCPCLRWLAVITHTFLHCGYVGLCPLSKEGLYSINTTCCELALLPNWGQCLSLQCHACNGIGSCLDTARNIKYI
jgi:hypothetical protein